MSFSHPFSFRNSMAPLVLSLGLAGAAHGEPDLTFVGKPAVVSGNALAGGTVTIQYVVTNQGNQAAAATKTRVQIFTPLGTQYSYQDFPIGAVAAGEQRIERHTVPLKLDSWTATWEVSVRLDTGGDIDEDGYTGNNSTDRALFHLDATLPDLTFAYGAQSIYQDYVPYISPAAYGAPLRISCDIKNDSTADAPATRTRVEITDDKGNFHVKEYLQTPSIPAGATVPFSYVSMLPDTGSTTKKWSVTLYLDDYTQVTEASKINNVHPSFYFFVSAPGTSLPPSPAPVGLANPRVEAGQLVFELAGMPGSPVTVQTSTNLIDWSTQATPMITNGVTRHTVPVLPGPHFFRVR